MDQDFYIEQTSPIKIFIVVILFLGVLVGGVYYYLNYRKENVFKLKNVTYELGDKLDLNINTYLKASNLDDFEIDLSSVQVDDNGILNSTGEYSYKIKKNNEIKKGKIYVKDTISPIVEVENLTVGVNEVFEPSDFVLKCDDLSLPCSVKFSNPNDIDLIKSEGEYSINILVSDAESNSVKKSVKLVVKGENSLKKKKQSDLLFDHLSESDESWKNEYIVKFDKALEENSLEFNQLFEKVSTKELSLEKDISEKKIMVAYNRYNYAIGITIKVVFNDNSFRFLTSNDIVLDEEATTENN